ncbi:MAG: hypothetical protein E7463_12915 [Ruminococcaceae bacterium]|nr:hypothetical protein [Oscillospiraceae bacterium]
MQLERNYDFCKRLLEVHKRNRRDRSLTPGADEFSFISPVRILMPPDAGEIIETAAKDFADYLFRSMNVTAYVDYDDGTDAPNTVRLALSDKLGKANERRGHRITVGSNLTVEGFDEAGVAQGLYYCEDVMNLREAPFLKKGSETRRVMFHPRTVQSGYGGNEYPDDYLALLAHHGFSAIALWIKGPNESLKGYTNFTDIAARAARYGFDIYVQCFTRHDVYPIGDEAQEYYDRMYGDLFAQFPFIKGLSIVGEAVKFQTRDPSLPEGVKPGWWPCSDWPLLLQMIRNAVDKVRPDVEIILSSYNWGYCDYRLRQKLIASLPKGVTLSCGWEMFEHYDLDGADEECSDYSLRVVKAGHYFLTETEAAVKYGIPVKTIANTGGKTWDIGAIPYDPAPYRWAERCEALRDAFDHNGLSSLIDSIHYGVYPSFISELTKWAFAEPRVDLQALIPRLLAMHFGHAQLDLIDEAMKLWSEAFANMVPTNEDQYGALRVGPSHPFYACRDTAQGVCPSPPQDIFAFHKITSYGMYTSTYFYNSRGDDGDVRIPREITAYEYVRDCIAKGLDLLERVENKNEELLRLINMGHFIHRTILTALNRKHYFLMDRSLQAAQSSAERAAIIPDMIALLRVERENARTTIPIVEADSILGFEPSMEYVTDRRRLEWKLNQVDEEIAMLEAMLSRCQ